MVQLSIKEILHKITKEETFEAVVNDYSFTIKIDKYTHYACAAVHDGNQFRKVLWNKCSHSAYDRWYEEDPATKQMIQTQPIVIAGLDSRFEYDLNRAPENAIYTDAWGKKLWKKELTDNEKAISLQKHANFYKVVHALVAKIEEKFGVCIVYDMHSYNWKRWTRDVPTWNLGTSNIDENRFKNEIESWRSVLENTPLPNQLISSSKINDTFAGNGYFLKYITQNFNNTLVLATEIAKIYCNELTQILYPEVIKSIENHLKTAIKEHANAFYLAHKL